MPTIPQQVDLARRSRYTGDNGHWLQHHRDDALHVGVVSRRAGRQQPVVQSYYADYLPNEQFSTLDELRQRAKSLADSEVAAVLQRWPAVTPLEPIVEPQRGHAAPSCSIDNGQPATHLCVLLVSWHELCNVHVFLGKKAVAEFKKSKAPAVWLQQALAARASTATD